ncbi:hypothetical protein [Tenacibaculum sp. A30]|uniref:hypothetical protein n=1 Tax=Tenacibaculum sp. A30 TaxID=3442644 RepID=UPI003EB7EA4E
MNFTEEFYEGLANLFYAVSMADKNMTVEEKKSIVKRVEKNWSNSDNSGSEQVYETLRSLVKDKLSSEEAYENFKNYYLTHQEEFSKDVIHNLLVAAHEISNSTASKNKSELIILAKLYKLFKLA